MDSLKEMDYVSVKDDLRDRISAFYGVSKVLWQIILLVVD